MTVNAHKRKFFSPFTCIYALALRENKSTTAHAQTFFQSIHVRFSLSPRGQVET